MLTRKSFFFSRWKWLLATRVDWLVLNVLKYALYLYDWLKILTKNLIYLPKTSTGCVVLYAVKFDSSICQNSTPNLSVLTLQTFQEAEGPHRLLCSDTYTDIFMINVHHVSVKSQETVVRMCRLRLISSAHHPFPFTHSVTKMWFSD